MIKELETLRADMNKRIDEIKSKIEKPAFEVGKWYKGNHRGVDYLWFAKECDKDDTTWIRGYGFTDGEYSNSHNLRITHFNFVPATPTEVQQALEKEAVKRGLNTYKVNCLRGWHKDERQEFYTDRELEFVFESDKNMLWIDGSCYLSMCIFNNGTWATPIKTMTIDDLAANLSNGNYDEVINYLTENKAQIIETLNNLQNEPTE